MEDQRTILNKLADLERMFIADRDFPKERTMSEQINEIKQTLVELKNTHERTEEKTTTTLNAILEQTKKHNGRMSKMEDETIPEINKQIIALQIEHVKEESVLKGKTTVIVAIIAFVATIIGSVLTKIIVEHL
jgi:metal-responsive CopG/Arc/MetJ family transcriptional regulator